VYFRAFKALTHRARYDYKDILTLKKPKNSRFEPY
jgi:hypothetical protein